ncbi:MAG: MBL fold metallo-hydrolase [Promethearchaeota archaeon]|nr:MAG: MBL fold metallo-hydrolase [Candidatus Lokiarchaeota archaeon]
MKVIFLGTNGWFSTLTGNTSCILIDSREFYIILDAGDGLYKIDNYIKDDKPILLFLSHLHLDHIVGIHIFNKFQFKEKMQIYGYTGIKKNIDTILRHPFTVPLSELPFNAEIHEIEEGEYKQPVNFNCKLLVHSDLCLGYRFELDDKKIAYCTDTGMCDNILELANDVDLLISECSYKSGQFEDSWPHLNPESAANIAKQCNVKQLIITHFDASLYKTMEERKQSETAAKIFFNNTIAAYDGLNFEL